MPDEWIKCPKCGDLVSTRYEPVRCMKCGSFLSVPENREQKQQREAEREAESDRTAFAVLGFILFIIFVLPIAGLVEYFKPPLDQQMRWAGIISTAATLSAGATYLIFHLINRKKYPNQVSVDPEHIQLLSFYFFFGITMVVSGGIVLNSNSASFWSLCVVFLGSFTVGGVISYLIKKVVIYFSR